MCSSDLTHDGLMILLTVGRNCILSLVVWFLRCISEFLQCCYVHYDVSFSMFFPAMVRCSSFMLFLHSSVHSSIYVDLVLPGVEVLCLE